MDKYVALGSSINKFCMILEEIIEICKSCLMQPTQDVPPTLNNVRQMLPAWIYQTPSHVSVTVGLQEME